MNWAIHLCFINGVALGIEIVEDYEDTWVLVIDLLIVRIGVEIEKAHS
jgi:hypothetical protein